MFCSSFCMPWRAMMGLSLSRCAFFSNGSYKKRRSRDGSSSALSRGGSTAAGFKKTDNGGTRRTRTTRRCPPRPTLAAADRGRSQNKSVLRATPRRGWGLGTPAEMRARRAELASRLGNSVRPKRRWGWSSLGMHVWHIVSRKPR